MNTYRVSLGFARLPDGGLDVFTGNVIDKMAENSNYPVPRIKMEDLMFARDQFAAACQAAVHGGKLATATKNSLRLTLLGLLRQEAAYVQSVACENLPALLSSGFDSTKLDRTKIQLPQPIVERVYNPMSGQLG